LTASASTCSVFLSRERQDPKVAEAIESIFTLVGGTPRIIQTDQGSEFRPKFEAVLWRYATEHTTSSAYSPQTNGQVERFHATLKRLIKSHMTKYSTRKYIPELQRFVAAYNVIPHTTTTYAPIKLHFGSTQVVQKAAARIQKYARKAVQESKRPFVKLRVGDSVRVAVIDTWLLIKPVASWSKQTLNVAQIFEPQRAWSSAVYVLSVMDGVSQSLSPALSLPLCVTLSYSLTTPLVHHQTRSNSCVASTQTTHWSHNNVLQNRVTTCTSPHTHTHTN